MSCEDFWTQIAQLLDIVTFYGVYENLFAHGYGRVLTFSK